ncbi:MAG: ABC transporter permease [Gemmatimonadota bacterium]
MSAPRIPKRWLVLLRLLLPRPLHDEALGDLAELASLIEAREGRKAAEAAIRREVVRLAMRAPSLRAGSRRLTWMRSRLSQPTSRFPTGSIMPSIRYALRSLARAPGFTAITVLTLALGIGANASVFSVVESVLIRPLPYEDPGSLRFVWTEMRNRDVERFFTSFPMFQDYERDLRSFESLGFTTPLAFALTGDGADPEQVDAAGVSIGFFETLGIQPVAGRTLQAHDFLPGEMLGPGGASPPTAALISHGFWVRRFGGDPGALGATLELDGQSVEVAGVLPPDFTFELPPDVADAGRPEIWTAHRVDFAQANPLNAFSFVVGRLAAGATDAQLDEEMDRLGAELRQRNEAFAGAGLGLYARPLLDDLVRSVRPMILALLGAVGFVLLIACANVANLVMVRASTRDREAAIRLAMGGGRGQVALPFVVESVLLAGGATALGVAFAWAGVAVLEGLLPPGMPRAGRISVNGAVLGFSVLAGGLSAILFGLLPALHGMRPDLATLLKDRSSVRTASRTFRDGIAVGEVALSVALLVGAVLMVRSMAALQNTDPGFDSDGVLTLTLAPPAGRYPDLGSHEAFRSQVQARLEAIPGVEYVGAASPLPMRDGFLWGRYGDEAAIADPSAFRQANYRVVQPGYLDVMDTPLLEGRRLVRADDNEGFAVVMVDEVLAESMWPGESAVGKRLLVRFANPEPQWVDVIGVVGAQKQMTMDERPRETIYFTPSFAQWTGPLRWTVRTAGDPTALGPDVVRTINEIDSNMPVTELRPMSDFVSDSMAGTRFALALLGAFSSVALVLSLVGLYGVLSSLVAQRRAEIGVRLAFGAEANGVLRIVVGRALGLAVVGIASGFVLAFGLGEVLSAVVVGVSSRDPLTYLVVGTLFLLVSVFAAVTPALRALRIDPVEALRGQ